jgi:hypothetical protein
MNNFFMREILQKETCLCAKCALYKHGWKFTGII